jgi:signal transduction histidine kinase
MDSVVGVRGWRPSSFAVDSAIAAVLTVVTQVQIGPSQPEAHVAMLLTLSLAFRRRAPLAVAVLAGAAAAAQGLGADPPSVFGEYVAITLVAYTAAAEEPLARAVAGLAAISAGIVLHDIPSRQYGSAGGVASDLMTPVAFWGIGRAVRLARARTRVARTEAEEAQAGSVARAEAAVTDERRRLARELHDIVTHSLGVIVLHAQGGRRVLDGADATVDQALATIEQSGRSALEEMQRLLGLLRDEGDRSGVVPQPRLADLDALIDRVAEAGLPVRLRIDGTPVPLEPGVELSAYRVIQEALTNGLKHAHGAETYVNVRYSTTSLELEVIDDGAASDTGSETLAGGGHGLVGMQERVGLYGGRFEHERRAGGGFRVLAAFPLRARP